MREILFKAKRLDNGDWVEGLLVKYPSAIQVGDCSPWYIQAPPVDPDDTGGRYNVDPSTVCEYTGLTDKNGKKIFEGDILDESGEHFTVVYDSNWAKFRLQYHHAIQFPEWNRGVLMEVIGSIHDGEGGQHEEEQK